MMKRAIALALAIMLVPGARTLRAQQIAYAATPELDSATQAALTRDIARARDRGIPVAPLVAKVNEGRVKRAAGVRIRTAVAALTERLDSARAALGAESSADELVAGADALQAGALVSSLRAVRAATTRSVAMPLGTLAQLIASGVAPNRAVGMIVDLLRRNATAAQLVALGNYVETDVASGLKANESATIRLRGIEGSVGFGADAAVTAAAAPGGHPTPGVKTTPKRAP